VLQGGLRPGEVLNVHLEDIQYGRRRVVIRYRDDHPKGVRTKSRQERVVDLHEPEALQALSTYVMQERPQNEETTLVFLVGGQGKRRLEPLGYHALVKLFERHCERLGIRDAWINTACTAPYNSKPLCNIEPLNIASQPFQLHNGSYYSPMSN